MVSNPADTPVPGILTSSLCSAATGNATVIMAAMVETETHTAGGIAP